MKESRTIKPLLLALGFTLFSSSLVLPSQAQSPLLAKAAGPLTAQVALLPVPGLTLVEKDTYRYEAGAVDTIRTPHLERAFTLKNTTRQPITLTRLRGSCGCETLLLLKGGVSTPTTHLAPGEQAVIHLSVNLHTGQPGAVRKYVWIDGLAPASGQTAPLATLEVDILLEQSVSFTPRFLDFGKIEAGAGAKQSVTVSFDPALFPTSILPLLSGTGPDMRTSLLGPLQHIVEDGKPRLRQTYQVTLSPSAHAGSLSSGLWLELPPAPGGQALAPRVDLPVTGQVAGALDALPASMFFGSLPAGKPATRSVALSLGSSSGGQSLSVTTSNPWLHAALDQPTATGRHRLLSITLTDQAPLGPVQGKVTVILGKEDRLDIPVIAELTK